MERDVDELITGFLGVKGSGYRAYRDALIDAPRERVVPLLLKSLSVAKKQRTYGRIVNLLADIGGQEAAKALIFQARTRLNFPAITIRALAKCDDPRVKPVLVDLALYGRPKQRSAATGALTRDYTADAIHLCTQCARDNRTANERLLEAFRNLGRHDTLARRVLAQHGLTDAECVKALVALAGLPVSLWPFNLRRFLDREAASPHSAVRAKAATTAELLRARETLLRPSEAQDETLLRAASGPGRASDSELLRASDAPDDSVSGDNSLTEQRGWWSRVRRAVTGS